MPPLLHKKRIASDGSHSAAAALAAIAGATISGKPRLKQLETSL
jgi:hypothetical protein